MSDSKAITVGSDGNIILPQGTNIAGINIGTISIKGSLSSTDDLPTQASSAGDAYMIGSNLWVASNTSNPTDWNDVGNIRGPQGPLELQMRKEKGVRQVIEDLLDFRDLQDLKEIKGIKENKATEDLQDSKGLQE